MKKNIIWVETDKRLWLCICEQNLRFTRIQSSGINIEQLIDEITEWLKNKWDTSYISSTWQARDTMTSFFVCFFFFYPVITYTSLFVVVIPLNIDSIAIQRSGNSPWKYKGTNMTHPQSKVTINKITKWATSQLSGTPTRHVRVLRQLTELNRLVNKWSIFLF